MVFVFTYRIGSMMEGNVFLWGMGCVYGLGMAGGWLGKVRFCQVGLLLDVKEVTPSEVHTDVVNFGNSYLGSVKNIKNTYQRFFELQWIS